MFTCSEMSPKMVNLRDVAGMAEEGEEEEEHIVMLHKVPAAVFVLLTVVWGHSVLNILLHRLMVSANKIQLK